MAFPGKNYAPPAVYATTRYENPFAGSVDSLKIPVLIGEGNEYLSESNLEMVRGSSSTIDQERVKEDMTGRAVVSVSTTGVVTLGDFDGSRTKIQVRNYPIVNGKGSGTVTYSRADVSVTINGDPIVVLSVNGSTGILELSSAPQPTDSVKVTYFFNRTDTYITDDVSDQVTTTSAIVYGALGINDVDAPDAGTETLYLHGDILGPTGAVQVAANNRLNLIVDGVTYNLTVPTNPAYTMTQLANVISALGAGSLVASKFNNNFGESAISFTATQDVTVLSGSLNALIGLSAGQTSGRNRTFYTFQGPIVDGTNGGVTTTDTAKVTVKVNGVQVIPVGVDGASRAVTLPTPPSVGSTVTISYWFNAWQDTFDYLPDVNVVAVNALGDVPDQRGYTDGADFVLQDDKIIWGTSWAVSADSSTAGAEYFNDTQVSGLLIDDRTYMSPCSSVTTSSGGVSETSRTRFLLPLSPTLGNGRDTPLGSSLFQTVANERIDVASNRPDVVWAYWGFSVQDALDRGRVGVLSVEGNVLTLASAVDVGATVYATFWYNRTTDLELTLTSTLAGVSGVGTYTISNSGGTLYYNGDFDVASKGAGLTGVVLEFPSGSELKPDIRFEAGSGTSFMGPTDEVVTVTLAARNATPAKYTVPGYGPYEFVEGQSDKVRVVLNGSELAAGVGGLDLTNPTGVTGHTGGFFASLVSSEINYTGGTVAVVGKAYDIAAQEDVVLTIDGVQVTASVGPQTNVDISVFEAAINEAANGHQGVAGVAAPTTTTFELAAASRSLIDDYYVGWKVVVGNGAGAITAGSVGTVSGYVASTGVITLDAAIDGVNAFVAADPYRIYNPDTLAQIKGATRFNAATVIAAGDFDDLALTYTGDVSGASAGALTLAAGTYATAALLAAQVQTQLDAWTGALVGNAAGLEVYCEADADGRLVFSMQLPGVDSAGYLQFLTDATPAEDFTTLAGLDAASAVDGSQAALSVSQVARTYEMAHSDGTKPHDRLILRNRIIPGGGGSMAPFDVIGQCQLLIGAASGNTKAGLEAGTSGIAGATAVVTPVTAVARIGMAGGQDGNGQPVVTFYDGTGAQAANNVLDFVLDGNPVQVTFTATAGGTATALGPASGASNGSVLDQIIDALAAIPGAPYGAAGAVFAANIVRQEGTGLRLTGTLYSVSASLTIGSGSANSILGFVSGTAYSRDLVSVGRLVSALNANRTTSWANTVLDWSANTAQMFAAADMGIATIQEDASGNEYLYIQSLPVLTANYGASSSVTMRDPTVAGVVTDSWLAYNTRLLASNLDGAVGEAALEGFFVTSNKSNGSGSADTSVLNNGTGQDGIVGQTYRDSVTGLTFTLLPLGFNSNPTGPWSSYPTGATASWRIAVSTTFTTDANIPHNSVPGLELTVANTEGVTAGDTATLNTYNKGGNEPSVGDVYYVSYTHLKDTFDTAFFTKLSAIEREYGAISSQNPVTLAAYLSMLNGAVLVGIKQVQRAEDSNYASLTSYRAAIDELEGVLPGQVNPDIIIPLRGDSTDLYSYLRRSNEIQSSIRYKSERTSIIGMASGNNVAAAKLLAGALDSDRMRLVYPDTAIVSLSDALGNISEELVDGPMLAAALAGSIVSPNVDVATPWTGRRLQGFVQLGRRLDAVQMNQAAVSGITVLEEKPPALRVRHGLTTYQDQTNILMKQPTIRMIADEVQRQSRSVLENFIGVKFLPGILSQIEGRLAMLLKSLVQKGIISQYTGVKASVAADDPTVAEVEAYYSPVFPLLYIILTYHLRSQL